MKIGELEHISKLRVLLEHPNYTDPAWIQETLNTLVHLDQNYRHGMSKACDSGNGNTYFSKWRDTLQLLFGAEYDHIDVVSCTQLKHILAANNGWEGFLKIASHTVKDAAFIITQHADHDRAFQSSTLDAWEKYGGMPDVDTGYLHDRVKLHYERKPQCYGSQGMFNSDGIWQPHICETDDIAQINALRLRAHFIKADGSLESLEDYYRRMNKNTPAESLPPLSFLPLPPPLCL